MTTTRKLCRSGQSCTPRTLKEALDCLGHHGALTVRELAEQLGHVSEGTLGKQLSLYDDDNYPPLRHLVPLTLASRSDAVIAYLARAVGGLFVRVSGAGLDGALLGTSVREYGEMLQCHATLLADGVVTESEAETFAREADESMAATEALKQAIRARVKRCEPDRLGAQAAGLGSAWHGAAR